MTVSELIEELYQLPQDLPIVSNYKEVTTVQVEDSFYVLDPVSKTGYSIGSVVVLE